MNESSEIIKSEEYFRLSNGRIIKNMYELLNALESMNDDTFNFHVNENKNDFGNWIRDIFKDEKLSKSIFESKTREDIMKAIENRLFESNINKKEKNSKLKSNKAISQKDSHLNKIEEILLKEKEIAKREEKIEEIEARIEKELAELAAKKEPKFFSKEFVQGLVIGLLSASIIGLIYVKFFM